MSPLTPGCTALVTKGSKAGSEVTCIKHIGIPMGETVGLKSNYDCWEVSPSMPWQHEKPPHDVIWLDFFPTEYLMKINGDFEKTEHEEREELKA